MLLGQVERNPAGHEEGEAGAGGEQGGQVAGGRTDLFNVIEDEQGRAVIEEATKAVDGRHPDGLADAQHMGDGDGHVGRITKRREVDKPAPVDERLPQVCRNLQCQPGFANPTRSNEGHERHIWASYQCVYRVDIVVTADQWQPRLRSAKGGGRRRCWNQPEWWLGFRADPHSCAPGRRIVREIVAVDAKHPVLLVGEQLASTNCPPHRALVDAKQRGSFSSVQHRRAGVPLSAVRCPLWPRSGASHDATPPTTLRKVVWWHDAESARTGWLTTLWPYLSYFAS